MGLKRLTARAMPALILSANLPDVDSFVAPWFGVSARAERLGRNWTHPASAAFGAVLLYIGLNVGITERAVAETRALFERIEPKPDMIVASEVPLTFWKRHVLWRGDGIGGSGDYDLFAGARLDPIVIPLRLDDPRLVAAERSDAEVRDFLFWSRMPLVLTLEGRPYLSDQRFPALRRVGFLVPLDKR